MLVLLSIGLSVYVLIVPSTAQKPRSKWLDIGFTILYFVILFFLALGNVISLIIVNRARNHMIETAFQPKH